MNENLRDKEIEEIEELDLSKIDFSKINFDDIQELEEIVTPGNGSYCCC